MTIVLFFVSMIVLCMEGREACVEEREVCMEERTRMEENRSLSQSWGGWEKEPGWLHHYTPVSTVS